MSILPLHDSVYRALTNPDLDRPLSSTISTPLLNESPPLINTTPVSILSSSSQDNISAFSIVGGTSEDEEYTTAQTTSFIMPRVQHQQQHDQHAATNRLNNFNISKSSIIDIQITGMDIDKLFDKLNLYSRTLTHCNFHLDSVDDDDCPTIDLTISIAHSIDELNTPPTPFIPLIIAPKTPQIDRRKLRGAICKPIVVDSWSNKNDFMVLIDFLSNLRSPSGISSSNEDSKLPLNDVNSILINSVSVDIESKLLSLKEYPPPSGSHNNKLPSHFNIWVITPILTGIVCCCCYYIYKFII